VNCFFRLDSQADGGRELYVAATPMQQLETPQDVAAPVAFLFRLDVSYITGEPLPVHGGVQMHWEEAQAAWNN
jgi:NAD(P)-dependent dehydrogenase (short-subunit alcohol dehydrogenase family)